MSSNYHKDLIQKILDRDKWPDFENGDFLDELNEIADGAYQKGTIEGYIAALMIYHQLSEELLKFILNLCHFFIQLSIFPIEINFKIDNNQMYGYYLSELEKTIEFDKKQLLVSKCRELNKVRIEIVHKLTRKQTVEEIQNNFVQVKKIYDEIFEIFKSILDWFNLCYKDFKKDIDWEDYFEEYGIEFIEHCQP